MNPRAPSRTFVNLALTESQIILYFIIFPQGMRLFGQQNISDQYFIGSIIPFQQIERLPKIGTKKLPKPDFTFRHDHAA